MRGRQVNFRLQSLLDWEEKQLVPQTVLRPLEQTKIVGFNEEDKLKEGYLEKGELRYCLISH